MKKTLIRFCLVAALFVLGCDSPAMKVFWKEASNEFHGVSIKVPPSWEVETSLPGMILSAAAPSDETGSFQPNVNVVVEDRIGKNTGEAFNIIKTQVPLQLQLILRDYQLKDMRNLKIDGRAAVEFKGVYSAAEGSRIVHSLIIPSEKSIYTLTGTYPSKDAEKHEKTYLSIRDSFRLPKG